MAVARRWISTGLVALVFGVLIAVGVSSWQESPGEPANVATFDLPSGCPTTGAPATQERRTSVAPEGVRGVFVLDGGTDGQTTDECPPYESFPPADGPMAERPANCGFYRSAVSPPHAVRSLANGAVWIAFSPRLDDDSLDVVRATATRASHVLASPAEGLGAPIVLTAWRRQLWLDDVDDPRFDEFINTYLHSPDRPVVYARCDDGQGAPDASFAAPDGR